MSSNDLQTIVTEINSRAKDYQIGNLPEIRKKLKGLKRLPPQSIFDLLPSANNNWAFHHGGRTVLQFNLGIENPHGKEELRFGVAFSFAASRSFPKIDMLFPKADLFNDFMNLYPDEYADMKMWHYIKSQPSSDYRPTVIPPELAANHVFVFLGKRQKFPHIDYELILDTLDRLLPIYHYVESQGTLPPVQDISIPPFQFRSGYTKAKASLAKISQAERELDANLRHNIMQENLCKKLSAKYGSENVGDENPSGVGTRIDVVVRRKNEYWLYEIKTANSPRACIRQAIGQLLEYAFWNDAQNVTRLVVVGETALDKDGEKYLRTLRKRFSLPVEYEHLTD